MVMVIIVIIIIIIAIIYFSKKSKSQFFSLLVRDEEKTVEDLTGRWNLIDKESGQKMQNCYMTFGQDGSFLALAQENEGTASPLTMKGTYIVKKDNNKSIMQKMIKNPEDYEWYQVIVDITEVSSDDQLSKVAYGLGINKNNSKEMLQCTLNAEEVCEWYGIDF